MVIHDFAYADVAFDGYQPPSFLSAKGASSVGVEFTTMSKGYNMAGWRVGFCAGNAEMIKGLGMLPVYMPKVWLRTRKMTKRWPWTEFESYLDRPLGEIREEFGIEVFDG